MHDEKQVKKNTNYIHYDAIAKRKHIGKMDCNFILFQNWKQPL